MEISQLYKMPKLGFPCTKMFYSILRKFDQILLKNNKYILEVNYDAQNLFILLINILSNFKEITY